MTTANTASQLPYRPCAGMMVINKHNHVFVGRRIDMVSQYWQMPQGGIDPGEQPLDAALRELMEEIGTQQVELLHSLQEWIEYDLPEDLVGKVWKGKYRGQKQKWFLFRFLGENSDINIATKHAEFAEWKWSPPENLVSEIVPFKRDIYETIVTKFSPFF
ncbi:RNA pyrophosphohydrolase [Sneathiella marina]|uniref:RNA pyrophosphohydrolase n=1 Tax=Sneathiella marina TaxID=2950108 RepID=A0ABY4W450_9PROT|nr:RNA pyrophosphohydrolase [Sneathiella marina]USG61689.1 RNA pyrophosphohydrolase [Sneathiella marina]